MVSTSLLRLPAVSATTGFLRILPTAVVLRVVRALSTSVDRAPQQQRDIGNAGSALRCVVCYSAHCYEYTRSDSGRSCLFSARDGFCWQLLCEPYLVPCRPRVRKQSQRSSRARWSPVGRVRRADGSCDNGDQLLKSNNVMRCYA